MALSTYPAVASPVKSIQRGAAGGAGNVTITAINPAKSTINVFGTTSSGTVSASFNMSMNAGSFSLIGPSTGWSATGYTQHRRPSGASVIGAINSGGYAPTNGGWQVTTAVNSGTASVGAGSNNLVAAVVQGFIADATTVTLSGACRWEVVEYN